MNIDEMKLLELFYHYWGGMEGYYKAQDKFYRKFGFYMEPRPIQLPNGDWFLPQAFSSKKNYQDWFVDND